MMRAFVGILIPPEITRMLTGVQVGLEHGRLVPPESFHSTLASLGEQPEPVIEDVHTLLDGIHPEEIELNIEGLGVFGGEKPRLTARRDLDIGRRCRNPGARLDAFGNRLAQVRRALHRRITGVAGHRGAVHRKQVCRCPSKRH